MSTTCCKHVAFCTLLFMVFWINAVSQDAHEWMQQSQEVLKNSLNRKPNNNIAKNVILFIGDGLGMSTVTAARILRGQLQGKSGEETVLEFEKFPHVALSKTYVLDRQTADSSGAATALMAGIKTNFYTVGVDGTSKFGNCKSIKNAAVKGILHWSQSAGKSTGFVTNARVTHATTASAFAHSPNRNWEGDVDIPKGEETCRDIAYQLVVDNSDIKVILGGGRKYFLPNTSVDPETGTINTEKGRRDGLNLIQMWKLDKEERGASYNYVRNNSEFTAVDPTKTDYLLGLFASSHMEYELERDKSGKGQPSLAEMTRKAIQLLKKNDKGFFLLVEGARIDHGHHDGKAKKALHETLSLEDAVKTAVKLTDEEDTLIIVTGDHSHVFNIAGYPKRGNDILGIVEPVYKLPLDGKAYTTLLYANGPGYSMTGRIDPRDEREKLHDNDYIRNSGIPMSSETHGGEDVAIYANGPMSHLIHGVQEQNYVAHVMAYASCVGPNKDHCRGTNIGSTLYIEIFPLFLLVLSKNVIFS